MKRKIGRNDPCPCGSGKKFKNCCQRHGEAPLASGADALFQEALSHHRAGRLERADELYRQVLIAEPDHPASLHFSGVLAYQRGEHARAKELIRRSLALRPDDAEAHFNLATILQHTGELRDAERCYRESLRISPQSAEALVNLGNTLKDLGDVDEAIASYRKAVALRPKDAVAQFNFGNLWRDLGNSAEAAACYRSALRHQPEFVEAHNNLGNALRDLGDTAGARASYRKAIAIRRDYAEAHFNLGNLLRDSGDIEGADACYDAALSIRPAYADAYSNSLFVHAYHGSLDPQAYLGRARGWERACIPEHERRAARERIFRYPPLSGRRLRVGYLSGDFRTHAASYYVEQLFAHHDRRRIELFAYSTNPSRDAVTDRLRALAEHWAPVAQLTDEALRDRIEADSIDVLIDLSGHTGHNREGVFARRAAPVQAHYLGYMASTGLSEMDYWIGDAILTPPETDDQYSETVWRLPRIWVAYEGKHDAPAPECRSRADDTIHVGGFNNLAKLTPATLALWAQVLEALPKARLLLKTKAFAEVANRRRILDAMAANGVDRERIELRDSADTADWHSHMACYDGLDIALDPVGGMTGGTTTCDALWMGVPVVTLAGDRMASRMTASMLNAVGHEEWIARTEQGYVDAVRDLALDVQRRRELRLVLRDQMAHSPLCDARGLAASLEDAYVEMFTRRQLGRGR